MVLRRNGDGGGGSVVTDRGKRGTIENRPPIRRDHNIKNKTEPYVGFR